MHLTTRVRSRAALLATAVLVGGGLAGLVDPGAAAAPPTRPGVATSAAPGDVIAGEYIITLDQSVSARAVRDMRQVATSKGGTVLFDYSAALTGFAAKLPAAALAAVEDDPRVAAIEPNRVVTAFGDQYDPSWGLDRIDQRSKTLNRSYHYDQTGAGVTAYVIDTGIRITHTQFGTRASHGFTAIADGQGANDCNGHGTHVAGTVGSSKWGVAKAVKLVAVRVLGCDGSGSNAGVIDGIDFVAAHHLPGKPAVANMSLGGGFSAAVNSAVANAIADGVSFVVAAGNENVDACGVSPASAPNALTVGATTYTDARASYSNFGTCLDLFAPGSQVLSTWIGSDNELNIINGTSMASPHVAGVVATYLQANPAATPAQVTSAVRNSATNNVVTNLGAGSPNKLLYSKFASTNTSPAPPASANPVRQPGFESGPGIWKGIEDTIECLDAAPTPRVGRCQTYLQGYGSVASDMLGQTGIVVPAGAGRVLTFYTKITTQENSQGTAFDRLFVRVISGGVTTTLATYSNLNKSVGYVKRTLSLDAFAGKTVELRFVGQEDSSLATSFFIDDVAIS
ncbi:S8 family peptidase [Nocardioides stalactiti]|uniref:S8 family peptidase n=1 Tax=Nocardioides stalactiti TaxID=2755356 RepID=UPI0015FF2ED7|nr:S8 family peptidase [Nocardioides stalactiti]